MVVEEREEKMGRRREVERLPSRQRGRRAARNATATTITNMAGFGESDEDKHGGKRAVKGESDLATSLRIPHLR